MKEDPRFEELKDINEASLQDKIANLRAKLEKLMIDRNHAQLERVRKNFHYTCIVYYRRVI